MGGRRSAGGIGLVVSLALAMAGPVVAGTPQARRWVDDDGLAGPVSCDGSGVASTSLDAAVDASSDGDTVKVCPGVYREAVTITTPGIIVEGVTPHWGAVIRPPATPTSAARVRPANGLPAVITITANRVLVRWLKVEVPSAGCYPDSYGLLAEGVRGLRIRGNKIINKPSPWSWDCGLHTGIQLTSSRGLIGWNMIRDATANGIRLDASSGTVYRNSIHARHAKGAVCPATGCTGTSGLGVVTQGVGININVGSQDVTVQRNHIETDESSGWSWSDGIDLAGATATIEGNTVLRVDTGIDIANGQGRIKDNTLVDGGQDGIFADATSPASGLLLEISGNRVSGFDNGIDMRQPHDGGLNVHGNDFSGNRSLDCIDATLPGSGNTWSDNVGDEADPVGICEPLP